MDVRFVEDGADVQQPFHVQVLLELSVRREVSLFARVFQGGCRGEPGFFGLFQYPEFS